MLTLHFIAGLRSELQEKMTSVEGTFDQVLEKARFKEARCRELHLHRGDQDDRCSAQPSNKEAQKGHSSPPQKDKAGLKCHYCGEKGHFARECPMKGRAGPREATGTSERGKDNNHSSRDDQIRTTAATLPPPKTCQYNWGHDWKPMYIWKDSNCLLWWTRNHWSPLSC